MQLVQASPPLPPKPAGAGSKASARDFFVRLESKMLAELQPSVTLDHVRMSRASLIRVRLEPERICQGSWDPEDGIDISSTSTLGDFAQHGTSTA